VDATLYAGCGCGRDAELWIDPEIDQGFGLAEYARRGRLSQRRSL
jgi:hypothetical protein